MSVYNAWFLLSELLLYFLIIVIFKVIVKVIPRFIRTPVCIICHKLYQLIYEILHSNR